MSLGDYKPLVFTVIAIGWTFFGVMLFIYLLAAYGILGFIALFGIVAVALLLAERIDPSLRRR